MCSGFQFSEDTGRIIRRAWCQEKEKKGPEGCKALVGGATERPKISKNNASAGSQTFTADLHMPSPELCPPPLRTTCNVKRPTRRIWCSGLGPGTAPSASTEGQRTLQRSKVRGNNCQLSVHTASAARRTNSSCRQTPQRLWGTFSSVFYYLTLTPVRKWLNSLMGSYICDY